MSDTNIREIVGRIVVMIREQTSVSNPATSDLDLTATFDQICMEFPNVAADEVYAALAAAHHEIIMAAAEQGTVH
jgi:hypothetical protein